MDAAGYAEALVRESEALARAADGNLDLVVPSCPDWRVADLVFHVGEVHRFWGEVVDRRLQDGRDATEVDRPVDADLLPWFRSGAERLCAVLAAANPDDVVWTWASRKDVSFVRRRMGQETAVHRVDAQLATGPAQPIDSALAVDGVDEFLDHFVEEEGLAEGSEAIHLRATDAEVEWLVCVADGKLAVSRAHGHCDAAVRAAASDLLLLLWRRLRPSDVDVVGNRSALDRFLGRADLS